MKIKENKDGSISIQIPRPNEMTIERFLTLAARLEKIMEQLGGNVRFRSDKNAI